MDTSTLAVGIAGLASTFLLFGVVLGTYRKDTQASRREEFWYGWAFRASMAGFALLPVTAAKCMFEAKTWVDALLCVAICITSGAIGWVAWGLWGTDVRERAAAAAAAAGALANDIVTSLIPEKAIVAKTLRAIAEAEDWARREHEKVALQ